MKIDEILLVNKENYLEKDYIPSDLVIINEPTGEKVDSKYKNMLTEEVYQSFKEMQQAALQSGFEIFVDSSYRSYEYQETVFQKNVDEEGLEYAQRYCALPGSSEHQTGLAFDVIPRREGIMIEDFEATDPEIVWCIENSHKYGFILRYPKGKENITGYNFEPWHYRYVGKEISEYMHDNNIETLEELIYKNDYNKRR